MTRLTPASAARRRRGQGLCGAPVLAVLAVPVLALAALGVGGCSPAAQPQPEVQPIGATPHTSPLPELLARYIDDEGRVDYAALKAQPETVAALKQYSSELLAAPPHAAPERYVTDAERLAYWLNLYNALALREILQRWPIASLNDAAEARSGFAGYGRSILYDVHFDVGGREMSLLDIETTIARSQFRDPRVHFALNCGTRSCPVMPRALFDGPTLEARLEQATRDFINRPRHVSVDHDNKRVLLSPILGWYEESFVAFARKRSSHPAPSLLDFIIAFAGKPLVEQLLQAREARYAIDYRPYDWRIRQAGQEPPDAPPEAVVIKLAGKAPLPAIELPLIDGSRWRSQDARGKVLLIDFWATWCRPCLRSFPHYAELQLAYERQGFEVVAVAQDESRKPVDRFVQARRPAISIALDPTHRAVGSSLGVSTLPTVLLVDRSGVVRYRHSGYRDPDVVGLRERIEALLEESPAQD